MKNAIPVLILYLIVVPGFSQMAPRDTATTHVGGKVVSVEYGRPSLKGRNIADLTGKLGPDRIWRAGSEQVTTFATEADLKIGKQIIKAGKYSLYLHCPENGSFSLILNKVVGKPLGEIWDAAPEELANEPWPHRNYNEDIGHAEVARIPLKKGSSRNRVELLTYAFKQNGKSAALKIAWGDETWTTEVAFARMEGSH